MHKHYLILLVIFFLLFLLRVQQTGLDLKAENPLAEYGQSLESLRNNLADLSRQILPDMQAALLSGMLFGVKSELPKEFTKALKNTSTIHIVVVSGQNLSMVAGFVLALKPYLGRRKTAIVSLGVVVFYSVLTGLGVPTIRAAIMVFLSTIAVLVGREIEGTFVLLLTAALMLIFDPNWLLSISFQLSFLATLGVITLAPELTKQLKFIPGILKQDLSVAISAQALTWPVIAANFHQFSLAGILVNTLVVWTVPFIMLSGMLAIALSSIVPFLGSIFALLPLTLLTYFINLVNFFDQKWNLLYLGEFNFLVWVGYYLLIFGFYLILKKGNQQLEMV